MMEEQGSIQANPHKSLILMESISSENQERQEELGEGGGGDVGGNENRIPSKSKSSNQGGDSSSSRGDQQEGPDEGSADGSVHESVDEKDTPLEGGSIVCSKSSPIRNHRQEDSPSLMIDASQEEESNVEEKEAYEKLHLLAKSVEEDADRMRNTTSSSSPIIYKDSPMMMEDIINNSSPATTIYRDTQGAQAVVKKEERDSIQKENQRILNEDKVELQEEGEDTERVQKIDVFKEEFLVNHQDSPLMMSDPSHGDEEETKAVTVLTMDHSNDHQGRDNNLGLKKSEESKSKAPSPEHALQNRREDDRLLLYASHDEKVSLIQKQNDNTEAKKVDPTEEEDGSSKNNRLIGFRFIIAVYFWFREYSYNPNVNAPSPFGASGEFHIVTYRNITIDVENYNSSDNDIVEDYRSPIWHSAHIGIPTALFIFLWKIMEAIQARDLCGLSTCKDTIKFYLSMASLIGSQAFLLSSIWLIVCEETDAEICKETFNVPSLVTDDPNSHLPIKSGEVGWYAGLSIMVVANLLESLVGIFFCCSVEGGMLRILSPILQAMAFASLVVLPEITWLYVAWSGLFFIWEGVILLMICIQDMPSDAPPMRPYWNALFKILAFLSFWVISGNFGWYYGKSEENSIFQETKPRIQMNFLLPVLLLLACLSFDALRADSKSIVYFGRFLPILVSFMIQAAFLVSCQPFMLTMGLASAVLSIWSLAKWIAPSVKGAGVFICSLLSCHVKNDPKTSTFQRYGDFIHFAASAIFFGQMFLIKENVGDTNEIPNDRYLFDLMLVNIGIGIGYFMHTICWISVHFKPKQTKIRPKYVLAEDTYTLMMYATPFDSTWFIALSVFVIQAVLITMIIFAQYEQHYDSSHFLDAPYAVTLSTYIGQICGMILILFYQNDYWVGSTLLEIRFTGKKNQMKGIKLDDANDKIPEGDEEMQSSLTLVHLEKGRDLIIVFPSMIRLVQSIGVITASTVLILQSDNIIDLVKDYTAIFFISEIDDFVFTLASHGYLGSNLAKDSKDAKGTFVPDVREHPFRMFGFMTIFSTMMAFWLFVSNNQQNGVFFQQEHKVCFDNFKNQKILRRNANGKFKNETVRLNVLDFQNGHCDDYLNIFECDFDGGDCLIENYMHDRNISTRYPDCTAQWLVYVDNGICDLDLNTTECGRDGGDCW